MTITARLAARRRTIVRMWYARRARAHGAFLAEGGAQTKQPWREWQAGRAA